MVKLDVVVTDSDKAFTSNDIVRGYVWLQTSKELHLKAFQVSCLCVARVVVPHTGNLTSKTYWQSVEDILPPPREADDPSEVFVSAGKRRYPFQLRLPSESRALASFSYKHPGNKVGIQWLVQATITKVGLIHKEDTAETVITFYPQYPPSKFELAGTKTQSYDLALNAHLSADKTFSSLFKPSSRKAERVPVAIRCDIVHFSFGIQLAPFTSGLDITLEASVDDIVTVKKLHISLLGISDVHVPGYNDRHTSTISLLMLEPGATLARERPFKLKCFTKKELSIDHILPGTFKSRFFEQSYILKVDVTLNSTQDPSHSKTWHIDHPATVLRRYIEPSSKLSYASQPMLNHDAVQHFFGADELPDEDLPEYAQHDPHLAPAWTSSSLVDP